MRKVFMAGISVASILIVLGTTVMFKGGESGVRYEVSDKTTLAQQVGTPEPDNKASTPALYKIGRTIRSESEQNNLYLYISVEPQNFTRDKMITLAHQLNHDFPDEKRLLAIILDDEEVASKSHGVANQLDLFQAAERGAYSLNRAENKEYIEFSTQPGKSANEI